MPEGRALLASGLEGQERVRDFLLRAARGRLGQAYLFVGPAGSGKLDAAYALAQAALCEHGGCGSCDDCERVARRSHPDVHALRPAGAAEYLVEQARGIIDDLALAPVRAKRKLYILESADRLGASAANALLKSLEEPPDNVTFVLLAPSRAQVLPTVASRCQAVPFRPVAPGEAASRLARELGAPLPEARRATACCPSPGQARGLMLSPARREARRAALECLARLPEANGLEVVRLAQEASKAADATAEELKESQRGALEEGSGFLSDSAAKALGERQRRELSACRRSQAAEQLGAMGSLLRDALLLACGRREPPACDDYADAAARLAEALGAEGTARALGALGRAERLVEGNVSPQLALESMLLDIKKEMVACRP